MNVLIKHNERWRGESLCVVAERCNCTVGRLQGGRGVKGEDYIELVGDSFVNTI